MRFDHLKSDHLKYESLKSEAGFSLIEVLVALGIVAVTLVALMGRLGASANVQYDLSEQMLMMDTAMNLLQKEKIKPTVSTDEKQGEIEVQGIALHWRLWSEKSELDGFVRQNIAVQTGKQPELKLFIYQVKR